MKIQTKVVFWMSLIIGIIAGCAKIDPEVPVKDQAAIETTTKSTVIDSANAVYIDPSATTNGTGTKTSPWNGSTLTSNPWKANTTYLFKRGTTYSHSNKINIQVAGVILGAYGTGAMPIIKQTASTDNIIGSGSLTIQDLELYSPNSEEYNIAFMYATGNINVLNCKIHGGSMGVRLMYCPTVNLKVIGCEIYDVLSDAMFIYIINTFEAGYNTVYDVNKSHPNFPDDGDCIHMDDIKDIWLHHNSLDHTSNPGKFCVLVGATTSNYVGNALIEYNTMKRNRAGDDETVFYSNYAHGSKIVFRYNKIQDALVAIQSRTYDMQIYNNTFSNVGQVMELNAPSDFVSSPVMMNNTIYNCGQVLYGYGEKINFKNNIVHTITGTAFYGGSNISLDYNTYYQIPTFGNATKGIHDMTADPLLNNVSSLDFKLKTGSPCIDKGGVNTIAISFDIDGNTSPTGTAVDIGAYEYSTSTPVPPSNIAPVVTLTAPVNGQNFTAPASIQLTASASDADGTISKVEFFNGSVKLGESTYAPYVLSWTNVPAGTYNITAKATDNANSVTTSPTTTIYVSNVISIPVPTINILPSIDLTSPGNGQNYTAPATVTITANASDADGTISKVEYFNGGIKIGESAIAPYTFTWANVPSGIIDISAIATDNSNGKTTSTVKTIYVNAPVIINLPPAISITAPQNGKNFRYPATITISTLASDPDGKVIKVEFYSNGKIIGQSTTAPFSFIWKRVPVGKYSITAVATDNSNARTTSTEVTVYVNR